MERAAPARARVSDDAPRGSADLVLVRAAASGALGPAGPARLLARVAGAAARLCGARLASIALLTEGRDHLELRSVFGTGGVIAEQRLPVRQSLNGTVITAQVQRYGPRSPGQRLTMLLPSTTRARMTSWEPRCREFR